MQGLFGQFIVAVLLALCLAGQADAQTDPRLRPAVQDYLSRDPDGQLRWLSELLVHRTEPAARIHLSSAAWQELMDRHRKMTEAQRDGRHLRAAGVQWLVEETDRHERAAINTLVADLHECVAKAFADDPAGAQHWTDAWSEIRQHFERAGSPWDQQPKLLKWLRESLTQFKISDRPETPDRPEFQAEPRSAITPRPPSQPRAALRRVRPAAAPAAASPAAALAQPAPKAIVRQQPPAPPSVNPAAPRVSAVKQVTPLPALKQQISAGPATRRDAEALLAQRPTALPEPPVQSGDRHRDAPTSKRLAQALPLPPQNLAASITLPRPTVAARTASAPRIDEHELAARIASYNLALAELIGQLGDEQTWLSVQLDAAVDTLTELASVRAELALYWDLLSDDGRAGIKEPQSLAIAISLVAAKIVAARRALEASREVDVTAGADAELERLDEVSRRLAHIGASS